MQTQLIINHDAVPCLLNLLTGNYKKSIKKEACWTISNITAGNKEQIQAVILYMLQISCSGLPLCIISKAKSMTWVLSKVNTCIMDKAVFSHVQNVRIIHVYVVILRASQHCFRDITGWLTGNLQIWWLHGIPFHLVDAVLFLNVRVNFLLCCISY